MTGRRIELVASLLMVFGRLALAAEDDPIKAKLDMAKAAYDAEQFQYHVAVNKYFEKREEPARKQGNKKLVDQIKSEQNAFQQKGDLPRSAPAELNRKRSQARSSLEMAYREAVRDYTKKRMDIQAAALEKDLEQFKRDGNAPWVELFNGKDTMGWHAAEGSKAQWRIEGGTLVGSGEYGFLTTDRSDFENFRIRIEGMIGTGADSGILIRVQDKRASSGYEAQIGAGHSGMPITGSLVLFNGYGKPTPTLAPALQAVPPGQWFTLEVVAEGNRFTTWVDGKQTAQYEDKENRFPRGAISLQQFGPKAGMVVFRKVQIKELPSS